MLLKVCDENFMYILSHIKFLNAFCFFVILLFIILCYIYKNNLRKQILIILFSFLLILIIFNIIAINKKGCQCIYKTFDSSNIHDFKPLKNNKVIIVGDSRMSLIDDNYNSYQMPKNYEFVAKSGAKIDWFADEAINKIENILDNQEKSYKYHVVINMGVNDMSNVKNAESKSLEYFVYYKKLILKYPDVHFYILSVNPINKKLMNKYWDFMRINNRNIEIFNNTMIQNVNKLKFDMVSYCNSYNNIDFKTYDGLHYKHNTSQDIVNYISNKCIKYY